MSLGRTKIAANHASGLFEADRMIVGVRDGRALSIPFRLYPALQDTTLEQRMAFEMVGSGKGFHWPGLDLDLSIEGLIQGLAEVIPAPPRGARTARGRRIA